MIQWLFFYRVYAEASAFTIAVQYQLIVAPCADKAKPPVAFIKPTVARTQITNDTTIFFSPPFSAHSPDAPLLTAQQVVRVVEITKAIAFVYFKDVQVLNIEEQFVPDTPWQGM